MIKSVVRPAKVDLYIPSNELEYLLAMHKQSLGYYRRNDRVRMVIDLSVDVSRCPELSKYKKVLVTQGASLLVSVPIMYTDRIVNKYPIFSCLNYFIDPANPKDCEEDLEFREGVRLKKPHFGVVPSNANDSELEYLQKVNLMVLLRKDNKKITVSKQDSVDLVGKAIFTNYFYECTEEDKEEIDKALREFSEYTLKKEHQSWKDWGTSVKGWEYLAQGEQSILFTNGKYVARIKTNNTLFTVNKKEHSPEDVFVAAIFSSLTDGRYSPKVYGMHGNVSVVERLDLSSSGEHLIHDGREKYVKEEMLSFFWACAKYRVGISDLHSNNFADTQAGIKVFDLDGWYFVPSFIRYQDAQELYSHSKFSEEG